METIGSFRHLGGTLGFLWRGYSKGTLRVPLKGSIGVGLSPFEGVGGLGSTLTRNSLACLRLI